MAVFLRKYAAHFDAKHAAKYAAFGALQKYAAQMTHAI